MKEIKLVNASNETLFATIFHPEIPNFKLILINSATGVKQQVNFKLAQYLSNKGFTVITYDYIGIGLSKPNDLKNCKSSMRTWGQEDYKCITSYLKLNFENFEKYLIGHSVGALIVGMNEDSIIFKKIIFIATQKAFVGHLNFKIKIFAYLGFGILQPFTTKIFGYFPAHQFGLGESVPAKVAKDWRILILNRNSTNAVLEKCKINISNKLTQKVLVLRAEDDNWLTNIGVENLLKETFPKLKPEYQTLKISESPKKEIGHINFFRHYNESLWQKITEYINETN